MINLKINKDLNVSVVVPFYNRSKFLERLLDSVEIQTLPIAKIYIIDNGSTLEETLKAWKVIQTHDLCSKCLFTSTIKKNNANYARNLGYQLAETKYVAFLDSDDWWNREHLEKSINCLLNSNKVAVYSGAIIHTSNSIFVNQSVDINNFDNPFSLIMSPKGYIAQTSSYIVDKITLRNTVNWSEELNRHQDFDYFAQVYYKSSGWCYCPYANVNIDWHNGGTDINKIDYYSLIKYYEKWNHLFPSEIRKIYLGKMLFLCYQANADSSIKQFYYNEIHKYEFISTWKDRVLFSRFYISNRAKLINLVKLLGLKEAIKKLIR